MRYEVQIHFENGGQLSYVISLSIEPQKWLRLISKEMENNDCFVDLDEDKRAILINFEHITAMFLKKLDSPQEEPCL